MVTKYLVAKKFNAHATIDDMRMEAENLVKWADVTPKTQLEKVTANKRPAEWVRAHGAREDRAVLYLHGGGYNICSPNTHRELAAYISMASNAKVLLLDYRLAPEHPFPGALEDAAATYRWLLDLGFAGRTLALAGDSAGGGLAIATAIALREAGEALPSSIACLSPWTDLTMSGRSIRTHAEIDPMLNLELMNLMAANYIDDRDAGHPLISPLFADMQRIPPLLIQVGSDEMLLDDASRMAAKAERAGVAVTLKVYDRMWHVWHLTARIMPEAQRAIEELGHFVRNHFTN
jgi:acetyl esterase/lipase